MATPELNSTQEPTVPQGIDKQLAQQTREQYTKMTEQIAQQKKDDLGQTYIEKFDEIRKLGFASNKDIKQMFEERDKAYSEREKKLEDALKEVQTIRALMQLPRNSG